MDVLGDFMLLSVSKNFQDGRHDVIIAIFSKWSDLLEMLYRQSYLCAYSVYVVHRHWSKIKYHYGSHQPFYFCIFIIWVTKPKLIEAWLFCNQRRCFPLVKPFLVNSLKVFLSQHSNELTRIIPNRARASLLELSLFRKFIEVVPPCKWIIISAITRCEYINWYWIILIFLFTSIL